ncbi:2'-5' RNA ligase [Bacillus sp. OV322]|uniref:YjcG family protein n=1 Tax=Bacillus sp. OV322 TaxID=1882764 RepID=UPI0008E092C5|nr:YjcG family protein [Bacillus sp. OV322]SFB98521.1 2'-5' RNA ligase [Bacillus sp. OV322]
MNYGVAIFPSKKLQDKANSYRKRYDSHYALIPPHVTLKGAFEATDSEIKPIALKLKEIAKKYQPFSLKVLKASTFQPVSNTIYFKVENSAELEGLYNELNTVSPETSEYAFVPHITIGQKLSDDEHSDVFGQLSMLDLSHEEEIDRFHLLYQLDDGAWTVYETFRLGDE